MELTCKHFKGDRPCRPYWDSELYKQKDFKCSKSCKCYTPMEERILLIKLDAMGDVIRTTPLAEGIKKRYINSQLTWLVAESGYPFIKNNPFVDRVFIYNQENIQGLLCEDFDLLINLDKAKKATSLANKIKSKEKRGYLLSPYGTPFPANEGAKYLYDIALDNWGKKTNNKKSFQEMIFEVAKIQYKNEEYSLKLENENLEFARKFKQRNKIIENIPIVGINTGCGPVYPYKKWHKEGVIELIKELNKQNIQVMLFGGPDEIELNKELKTKVKNKIIDAGCNNTIMNFAALMNICNLIFTGDTVALHIAIALKKPVIAVFGPTPSQEIKLHIGKKLIGKVSCLNCYNQFPCIMDEAGKPNCMQTITLNEVLGAIKEYLPK